MTPLKFRAWDKLKKEMDTDGFYRLGRFFDLHDSAGTDSVIMQSTGLTDQNGVEIYEGDVIRWDDASKGKRWRVAQVVWSEKGCWCFRTIPGQCLNCYKDYSYDFTMGSFIYTPDTGAHGNVLEIIGNIYQNPELLSPLV